MGIVRSGARQKKTGEEAPAPLFLSSLALPALFLIIAVFDDGNFLLLPVRAGQFRQIVQFSRPPYDILLPSRKKQITIRTFAKSVESVAL
jgi:hypothetical protein